VYRWLRKGEVPAVLIDTTWIIYRDEVKDYLLSRHNQAGGAPRVRDSAPDDNDPGDLDASDTKEHHETQDTAPLT
jgi:hypothetical protein